MRRREFTAALSIPALPGVAAAAVSETDAATGVRAALERGALAAVSVLGKTDGFLGNPRVRIPLPGFLNDVAKLMRATGQGKKVDELVMAMNRAAEAAVPEAKQLLIDAAKRMTLQDAKGILTGGQTSVTDYFRRTTSAQLTQRFLPMVKKATDRVGLAQQYNNYAGQAATFGLVGKDNSTVEGYVTQKSLDGLYFMIGEQEKSFRQNPLGATSDIVKRVFGALR